MADITKLASTFKAWRLILEVDLPDGIKAIKRLEEFGLYEPSFCGYHDVKKILISVLVPWYVVGQHDQSSQIVEEAMKPFNGIIFKLTPVKLVCPEPCTTDGYLGVCSICGEEDLVMGPFDGEDRFLMGPHGPTEELLCSGTARPPKGEVRPNHMIICRLCGLVVTHGRLACQNCGTSIEDVPENPFGMGDESGSSDAVAGRPHARGTNCGKGD